MARSKEVKKKVVKSHKKLTKKSKSILATNVMLAKTLNLKKPKKNKNPLRTKTVTETVTVPVTESVRGIIKNVGGDFLINDIGGAEVLRSSSVTAGDVHTHVNSVVKGKEMGGGLDQSQNATVEITTEPVKDVCVGEGKLNTPIKQKKNKEIKNQVKSNLLKDRETTKKMSPKMSAAVLAVRRFNSAAASLPPPLPLSYSVSSVTLVSQASGAVQPSTPALASSADTSVSSSNISQKAINAKIGIVAISNTAKQSSSVMDSASTGAVTKSASSIITANNSPPYTSSQAVNTSLTPSLLTSSGVLTSTENYPHASAQASTVTAVTAAPAKRAKPSKSLTAAAQADLLGVAGPSEGKKKRKLPHIELCVGSNEVTVAAPAPAASREVVGLSSTAAADPSCAPEGSLPCTSGPSLETPLKESAVSTPTPTPGESPETSVAFTGGAMTPLTSSTGSNRGSKRNRRDSESAEDTVISSAEVTDDETPERGESFTVPPSFNIGDFTLL
jgi:hypothetical protein